VNPLLLPPRLLLRALEDLNAVADAARRLPQLQRDALQRLEEIEELIVPLIKAAEHLERELPTLSRLAASVDGLQARIDTLSGRVDQLDQTAGSLSAQAASLDDAARQLGRVVDSIPGV